MICSTFNLKQTPAGPQPEKKSPHRKILLLRRRDLIKSHHNMHHPLRQSKSRNDTALRHRVLLKMPTSAKSIAPAPRRHISTLRSPSPSGKQAGIEVSTGPNPPRFSQDGEGVHSNRHQMKMGRILLKSLPPSESDRARSFFICSSPGAREEAG